MIKVNEDRLGRLAVDLGNAWARSETVPAPSRLEPSLTTEDAYKIQELVIKERLERGGRRAGWKMGLTSAATPTMPIVGTLLSDMVVSSGSDLPLATMVGPMVEAEIVVRIGETIEQAVTVAELEEGSHQVAPGIEVIDYRTTDSSGPIDWIADNSTVAYAAVGAFLPLVDVEPSRLAGSLFCDGHLLATGRGDQVMGNPLAAVAWLSEHLVERGQPLKRGDVVLTGSLTGHHSVPPREVEFLAEFGDLGGVTVRFHP